MGLCGAALRTAAGPGEIRELAGRQHPWSQGSCAQAWFSVLEGLAVTWSRWARLGVGAAQGRRVSWGRNLVRPVRWVGVMQARCNWGSL